MHIAMVSEHASPLAGPGGPDAGGQNVHVRELSRALAAAGHRVRVHTRRDDPDLPDVVDMDGVEVHHVTAGPARPLPKDRLVGHVPQLAEELQRAWRADPPDLAHAHFWMSGLAASAAVRGLDVPLVQTFHALGHVKRRHQGEQDTSPNGRTPAEQVITRRADRIIATCEDEVFELLRLGGSRRHISVVPCGVDVDTFTPHGPALARGDRPRVVTVGRLVPRKGVDDVIAALARVPEAELLVGGGPPPGQDPTTDPELVRLRRVAARAGVADRVRFLGAVARADVPALLRSADVVVCAPWYEPFGMVPLEAMACGRPVVGTAVGGIRDTVVDGVTGVHVPPRRPRALAQALRELLGSRSARDSFGIAGRDRALARYSWPRIATATEAVYRDVLVGQGAHVDRGLDHEADLAGAGADGWDR
ncbi:glycosyltransferase [Pseudonocardia humida]|uniref:Glycosyltransferase n=1 Tax=Pseudonocardia humida TaxID=2800819 RepID=A0ABT0ZV11_9PSEU|nr:glycosyltransferase [Pseudonocardia humida]MCO1654564.1 glycosyltransferase [Pseudonocardia humida]